MRTATRLPSRPGSRAVRAGGADHEAHAVVDAATERDDVAGLQAEHGLDGHLGGADLGAHGHRHALQRWRAARRGCRAVSSPVEK